MNVPNMTPAEFMEQTPEELFLFVTHFIYKARKDGRLNDVAEILAPFGPEARRALLIGSGALLCMDSSSDYSKAIRETIGKTLYKYFTGGGNHGKH